MADRLGHPSPTLKHCTQGGQALAESLFALTGLVALWVAVHWLSHYQDAALSATHASRHAAFVAARLTEPDDSAALTDPFFTGAAHRWTDRHAVAILDPHTSVGLVTFRLPPLSANAQPATDTKHAQVLRRDWHLEDIGIVRTQVQLDLPSRSLKPTTSDTSLLKLGVFDEAYPVLARSTAILTGAGHASSDMDVQFKIGSSDFAWKSTYTRSRDAASEIETRAHGVDAGWSRPGVTLDWLQPWSGRVPSYLITEFEPLMGVLP